MQDVIELTHAMDEPGEFEELFGNRLQTFFMPRVAAQFLQMDVTRLKRKFVLQNNRDITQPILPPEAQHNQLLEYRCDITCENGEQCQKSYKDVDALRQHQRRSKEGNHQYQNQFYR